MTEMTNQGGRGRIVVGVDGSEASKEALLWAAEEAELTGASLEVVMVWEMPFTSFGRVFQVPSNLDYSVEAEQRLHDTIHDVLGASYDSQPWERYPRLKTLVLEGRPVPTLVEVANGADLLVVGSSGHGALVGMLLGSVSEHCIGHASCPVVVVRHYEQAA
jgi:nucleotide-binding universal stress UspA family protein